MSTILVGLAVVVAFVYVGLCAHIIVRDRRDLAGARPEHQAEARRPRVTVRLADRPGSQSYGTHGRAVVTR